jgi:hypothetical protein
VNLAEARGALASRGFDYLKTPAMDLMLNRGRNDFEDYWPWPWLDATKTGSAPLDIADLKHIRKVTNSAGHRLWGLEADHVDTATAAAAGGALYWYLQDTVAEHVNVCVLPATGETVTVDYTRQSPELAAPDAVPLIPVRYHSMWIDWTVVQAYKDSDNFAAAQALQGDINARMQLIVERYETRNRMHSPFMTAYQFSEDA